MAEHYGLKVNKNGMACCPFHEDKHPSMKVDSRYFCFGCNATGDSIDLARKLLGVSPFESMTRLAEDFGVDIWDKRKIHDRKNVGSKVVPFHSSIKSLDSTDLKSFDLKRWTTGAVRTLLRYRDYLKAWKIVYPPDREDGNWHPQFEESLALQDKVEYWLDILLFGDEYEKELLYEDLHEEVEKIEHRFSGKRR